MPSITTRQYNPLNGALLGNIARLSFGNIPVGATSGTRLVDFAFSGVTSVSNVKLGIMSGGAVQINASPQGIGSDGSASNGSFGIEHSSTFVEKPSLTRFFAGANASNTSSDANNVLIGTRDSATSQFVWLNLTLGSANLGDDAGTYRIFFDFV